MSKKPKTPAPAVADPDDPESVAEGRPIEPEQDRSPDHGHGGAAGADDDVDEGEPTPAEAARQRLAALGAEPAPAGWPVADLEREFGACEFCGEATCLATAAGDPCPREVEFSEDEARRLAAVTLATTGFTPDELDRRLAQANHLNLAGEIGGAYSARGRETTAPPAAEQLAALAGDDPDDDGGLRSERPTLPGTPSAKTAAVTDAAGAAAAGSVALAQAEALRALARDPDGDRGPALVFLAWYCDFINDSDEPELAHLIRNVYDVLDCPDSPPDSVRIKLRQLAKVIPRLWPVVYERRMATARAEAAAEAAVDTFAPLAPQTLFELRGTGYTASAISDVPFYADPVAEWAADPTHKRSEHAREILAAAPDAPAPPVFDPDELDDATFLCALAGAIDRLPVDALDSDPVLRSAWRLFEIAQRHATFEAAAAAEDEATLRPDLEARVAAIEKKLGMTL